MIDDEEPELLEDLRSYGFAIDYAPDAGPEVLKKIEQRLYDLLLLDFGDVGTEFGGEQGLSVLRHIKRVSPATITFAYTSKALESQHADFYRLSDGVLAKDAGIQDSMDKIEEGLKVAHSLGNVWTGLLHVVGVKEGTDEDIALQDKYVRALNNRKQVEGLRQQILGMLKSEEAKATAVTLLTKLIELGMQAA